MIQVRWRGWSSLRVMVSWTGSGLGPAPSIIEGRPWSTYVDGPRAQRISQPSHANGTDAGSERGGNTILGCKVAYVLCPPLMCPSEPGSSGRFPPLDRGVYDRLLLRQRSWCGTHTRGRACRSVATRLSAVQPSCLASIRAELDSSGAMIGVGGRSGQLRAYVRPV